MKLSLKQVYMFMSVITLLTIVFFILGAVWSAWMYLVALFMLVTMLMLWGLEWRCPKCGKHLGRISKIKYCPHCSNALELLF